MEEGNENPTGSTDGGVPEAIVDNNPDCHPILSFIPPANMTTLICLLEGESIEDAFPVKIGSTCLVCDLRPLIAEQLQPPLNKLTPKLLKVFAVCIHDDPTLAKARRMIDQGEIMALRPFEVIKDVIDITAERCIHLIIKAPSKWIP